MSEGRIIGIEESEREQNIGAGKSATGGAKGAGESERKSIIGAGEGERENIKFVECGKRRKISVKQSKRQEKEDPLEYYLVMYKIHTIPFTYFCISKLAVSNKRE